MKKKKSSPRQLIPETEQESGDITHKMLKIFFKGDEIYKYTDSILQDYKEFKEEVIHHLKFLQKECDEGMKEKNVMKLNGINNYITSFLIRNHLIDMKNDKF